MPPLVVGLVLAAIGAIIGVALTSRAGKLTPGRYAFGGAIGAAIAGVGAAVFIGPLPGWSVLKLLGVLPEVAGVIGGFVGWLFGIALSRLRSAPRVA